MTKKIAITVDKKKKLYVSATRKISFTEAERRRAYYARWLGIPAEPMTLGTKKHYKAYRDMETTAETQYNQAGQVCPINLNPSLIGLEGHKIDLALPNGNHQRVWVYRSNDWNPTHILMSNQVKPHCTPVSDVLMIDCGAKVARVLV